MKKLVPMVLLASLSPFLGAAGGNGCTEERPHASAAQIEQASQDAQMQQFLRNQPVPSFDWSLERHMLIEVYKARQRATNTFSVVQSEYTGKVLWSCPSLGFPLPYATQLTNPLQVIGRTYTSGQGSVAAVAIAQQEPNGLFTPAQSDATWVPCVDEKGRITPVYEEKHVTVFLRPVEERDGKLVPVAGSAASVTIDPTARH
jgi:hypothetical protein